MLFVGDRPISIFAWIGSSGLLGFRFYFFLILSFLAISSAFERTLIYRIV